MKGEGIRCDLEGGSDLARRHSFRSGLNQQADTSRTIVLGKRGQSRDSICSFHISTIM